MKKTYKEIADELVVKLNKNEGDLVFAMDIIKPKVSYTYKDNTGVEVTTKNYRSLRLYCHDESTGFRHLVYEDNFIPNKPDTFLSNQYKEALYKNFIDTGCLNFVIALYNKVKSEDAAK